MQNQKNLFQSFPPTIKSEWLQKLTKDLKGRTVEEFYWKIDETINVAPFYHPDDKVEVLAVPLVAGKNDWEISEDFVVDLEDTSATNAALLAALKVGLQAPRLIFKQAPDVEDWTNLLKDINLKWISTHLFCESGTNAFRACMSLSEYIAANYASAKTIKGSVNTNYLRSFTPRLYGDYLALLKEELPQFKLFTVDAVAQCTEVDNTVAELLYLLQNGNKILDFYSKTPNSLALVAKTIQFSIGVGKSYFVQIAKIRALKILWANVLAAYQVEDLECTIEAHFPVSTQGENENTNMIRATTQAMSAVLGGVHRLRVLPANANTETPTDFTHRIARNVQHLLKMESHLDEVQDPAAGSYYIEQLTLELAEQAWKAFQED